MHLRLAHGDQLAQPAGIDEGNLFRIETAAALLIAAYVFLLGSRRAFARLRPGSAGTRWYWSTDRSTCRRSAPFPAMYEPVRFSSKT